MKQQDQRREYKEGRDLTRTRFITVDCSEQKVYHSHTTVSEDLKNISNKLALFLSEKPCAQFSPKHLHKQQNNVPFTSSILCQDKINLNEVKQNYDKNGYLCFKTINKPMGSKKQQDQNSSKCFQRKFMVSYPGMVVLPNKQF